ncbi:hypothetical protein [Spirosoma rhododendri]|uniref:Outer membrane lipoprotein-sorting protein n=1 Tax=Spirosoma rhododendri TaxID=2728024 RepID=A0A7L5DLA1_9BACT|nr:hypothetical protein [Spirosoma rhododendri]QJD79196.1 hypothetical protein HH216_12800 [Spirosoma rhododendri]
MKRYAFIAMALLVSLTAPAQSKKSANPPAPGFDMADSDPKAVGLADAVMQAMGGRKAWDNTHLIAWNFFGARKLVWDKWTGDVRVDNLRNDQTVLLNINNNKGRVFRNGAELTDPDSVAKYVKAGKDAWINDSYWLVMPFKLKDSGVTLKYLGEDPTKDGKPADVVQMTFKNVGNTPDNKYKIWIDKGSHLVTQWAHYPKFTDEQPRFTLPWADYQRHGEILLSGERGERDLTDIHVYSGLPGEVFSDFTRADLSRYPEAK